MSVKKYGTRKGPDSEVLGSKHGSEDRSKFGVYALGEALGAALGAALESEVGTYRGSADGLSGGNCDNKLEGS